jgi:hypothetical protein
MVYSEQVKRRCSANEDTLQYLYSFEENIDILIVISVGYWLLVLCNIRSHSGATLRRLFYTFQPPMGLAIQVNMIALLPHPRQEN